MDLAQRSDCKEVNAKAQGCKVARKTLLKGSGSRAEIWLLGKERKGARVQRRKEDLLKGIGYDR